MDQLDIMGRLGIVAEAMTEAGSDITGKDMMDRVPESGVALGLALAMRHPEHARWVYQGIMAKARGGGCDDESHTITSAFIDSFVRQHPLKDGEVIPDDDDGFFVETGHHD